MTDHNPLSRRRFLTLAAAVAAVPVALHSREAVAADLPMVAADDPTAKGVGYVADAAAAAKNPAFKAGSACAKCALYSGAAGAASGPCGIFPGKAVSVKGWCTAYAAKA